MPMWCIEFDGSVEIEAETEAEALTLAWERVNEDPANVLMAEAERADEDEDDD